MKSIMRIVYLLIIVLIIHPHISMAAQMTGIYGYVIHLKNNKQLTGYFESDHDLYNCKGNKVDRVKKVLENQGTVRAITKLIKVEYIQFYGGSFHKKSSLVTAKSSVKEINLADIKSIERVCRKWDGHETFSGIPVVTDHMAEVISKYEFIASYLYNSDELAKDSGEPCGLCSEETIFKL